MKFRVDDLDLFERRLSEFGVSLEAEVEERDRFYQHPMRDFRATDECLRIRKRILPDKSEQHFLTYKGPKIDLETKTRREIDIPLEQEGPWNDVLTALGFEGRDLVRKFRRRGSMQFGNRRFDILFDRLPDLEAKGGGGTFVELETLADESEWENARQTILDLAERLGLSGSIRTSYLGLLTGQIEPCSFDP